MRGFNSTARSRRMAGQATPSQSCGLLGGLIDWALTVEGDQRTKHIALLLALHVNADGEAFPGVERLAEMSGMTPRTVESRLQALMGQGAVEDTGRRAGSRGTTRVLRVKNFRPASWQKQREGLAMPVDNLPTEQPSTSAPVASTPAVSLATSAASEQANRGNIGNINAQAEEGPKTKPSDEVKARLAEIKSRTRPVTVPGVRLQPAPRRPAVALYAPPGGAVGSLVMRREPQPFNAVLGGSPLAGLSSRPGHH